MSIKVLTIEHVKRIERATGNPFYVYAESCVNINFFQGWMSVRHPGRYNDFSSVKHEHRLMYEENDFSEDRGDNNTVCNAYIHTVLDFINSFEDVNDDMWESIGSIEGEGLDLNEEEE